MDHNAETADWLKVSVCDLGMAVAFDEVNYGDQLLTNTLYFSSLLSTMLIMTDWQIVSTADDATIVGKSFYH